MDVAQYLSTIVHVSPLPGIIIEYRKITQLLEKYIHLLPKFACFSPITEMVRVHPTIYQTNSATGTCCELLISLQAGWYLSILISRPYHTKECSHGTSLLYESPCERPSLPLQGSYWCRLIIARLV